MSSLCKARRFINRISILLLVGAQALAEGVCPHGVEALKLLFTENTRATGNSYVHPALVPRYNPDFLYSYQFTNKTLQKLNHTYHGLTLSKTIREISLGRDITYARIKDLAPELLEWNAEHNTFLSVNTPHMGSEAFIQSIKHARVKYVKNEKKGLSLVTWFVHPDVAKTLGRAVHPDLVHYQDLEKHVPYLVTILDLNKGHLTYLKELKKMVSAHLERNYGYKNETDVLNIYFHFPTGADTSSLHLHVRVNQNILPLERARSFTLDEIIHYLESGKTVNQMILDRQKSLGGFSVVDSELVDLLKNIDGTTPLQRNNILKVSDLETD